MKKKNIRYFLLLVGGIVLFGAVSSKYFFRLDLTSEKRYTLSPETKQILRQLDEPLYFEIYLSGDMPAGFRKLSNGIREMLDDFKSYSGHRLSYRFTDPSKAENNKDREDRYAYLEQIGLRPVNINKTNKDGSMSQQIIFPGATVTYKGVELAVNLLRNSREQSAEMNLNNSMESLEYELIKTIRSLANDQIEKIAFIEGHGELSEQETYDLTVAFSNYYQVNRGAINGQLDALDPYKAIIIAKPRIAFDEKDKFIIDRYIMRGGKVMWLLDAVEMSTDSLMSTGTSFALTAELNLEDQLFTYGARINPRLIQDMVYHTIPVTSGNSSQVSFAPWLYYPLVNPSPVHAATRNLNPVWLRYASDIDTVGTRPGMRKTVLLQSSPMSRTLTVPLLISLGEVQRMPEQQQFNQPKIAAVLLEGRFQSIFRNRMVKNMFPGLQETQAEESVETKMLVVSDGDIAANDVRNTPQGPVPAFPLGHDRYTRLTFGNKEFLVNALNYLTDDIGLMRLRDREFQLRLLNKQKVGAERLKWQIINVLLPVLLLLSGGLLYNKWRKYKYGK